MCSSFAFFYYLELKQYVYHTRRGTYNDNTSWRQKFECFITDLKCYSLLEINQAGCETAQSPCTIINFQYTLEPQLLTETLDQH